MPCALWMEIAQHTRRGAPVRIIRFFLSLRAPVIDSSASSSDSNATSPETPPRVNTTLRGLMKTPRIRGLEEADEDSCIRI